jgi:hypothetical protein
MVRLPELRRQRDAIYSEVLEANKSLSWMRLCEAMFNPFITCHHTQ